MNKLEVNNNLGVPKGIQIEQQLRAKILSGDLQAGTKLPSMLNLADQLDVSLGVVKQALHTLTVEGLLRSVPKVGVFVSERKLVKDIALTLPTVELEQISRIIKGARSGLSENYRLIIEAANNSFDEQVDLLKHFNRHNMAGILLLTPPHQMYAEKIKKLLNGDVPCVQALLELDGLPTDSATFDGFSMGETAVNHLIENGHTEIGLIDTDADALTFTNRNQGMDSALRKIGKRYDTMPKKISHALVNVNDPTLYGRQTTIEFLEKHPELTAVIAGNGHTALGIAEAIHEMGKTVPNDISIVSMGVDLAAFKHMTPPMTSIDEPLETICRRAVQMLISRIENTQKPRQSIQFAPELHDRQSVKKIS